MSKIKRPTIKQIVNCPELPDLKISCWETKEGTLLYSPQAVQQYNQEYNNTLNCYDGLISIDELVNYRKTHQN